MAVRRDLNKHKSKLSADAILIRCKADKIDSVLDDLLQVAKNDAVLTKLTLAKTKALEIVKIIEDYES